MSNVVRLPRELKAAQTELQRYLESTPADGRSDFRERFDHAMAKGAKLHTSAAASEDFKVDTWRLSPKLNDLLQRKTIVQPEYEAGARFLRDCFLGMHEGVKTTNYTGAGLVGASAAEERETRRLHHKREFMKAWESLDPIHHPALAWLIATLGKGVPLEALGAHWSPHLGKQTQSARGGAHLAMALLLLCRHYSIKHPLDIIESLEKLSAKLLEQRTFAD